MYQKEQFYFCLKKMVRKINSDFNNCLTYFVLKEMQNLKNINQILVV
jgi:hypothetical protein